MNSLRLQHRLKGWLLASAAAVIAIVGWYVFPLADPPDSSTNPIRADTSMPATQPTVAVSPSTRLTQPDPSPPTDVLSVLRLDDPAYPTRRPLDTPADLVDAAKIVLTRPAYVDPLGNLWITHPQGRPIVDVLAGPFADRTAVVRERVRYVHWPADGGPPMAVVGEDDALRAVSRKEPVAIAPVVDAVFARSMPLGRGILIPAADGAVSLFDAGLPRRVTLAYDADVSKRPGDRAVTQPSSSPTVMAAAGDAIYVWSPPENGQAGSNAVLRVRANGGVDRLGPDEGWPGGVIEIIPLADGSVLVLAAEGTDDEHHADRGRPILKLIPAPEKPASAELIRTVRRLARQLADADPTQRETAQRALEAQGPAAYPVLETLRAQLPPEAQVRIETLLGHRFAPTLAGLRPLEGRVHTLARFPGGGCVLRFDGGGTIEGDDERPARTVIPATVLVRPGRYIELIDPTSVTDFVPGRQSIQSVGNELLIGDPTTGPQRWIGRTLKPVLPKAYVDFDTVVAIDARRRWLLTSARQPGKTLLVDPTLPDPTPRLPVWTLAATGDVGRTDAGWPALVRGDRLFVLGRDGWRTEKPDRLHDAYELPVVFDDRGRMFTAVNGTITVTDAAIREASVRLNGDADETVANRADGNASVVRLAAGQGRLFAYTPDGRVRRFAVAATPAGPTLTSEATFTQGVPPSATAVWLDPAGRLVMATDRTLSVGFTEGYVPRALSDLMLHVDR